jgi:hypothetical protein
MPCFIWVYNLYFPIIIVSLRWHGMVALGLYPRKLFKAFFGHHPRYKGWFLKKIIYLEAKVLVNCHVTPIVSLVELQNIFTHLVKLIILQILRCGPPATNRAIGPWQLTLTHLDTNQRCNSNYNLG